MTLKKMVRKALFNTTMNVLELGREMGLISKYKDKKGLMAKEQGGGVSGWKITEETKSVTGILAKQTLLESC